MRIRPERPSDHSAIRSLVERAFQTARHADGDEHEFVDRLRASDAYLPELALVAEERRRLVGHVMLTRAWVEDGERRCPVLVLAPLAVVLERRGRGLGARLVEEACRRAASRGFGAVFLVGDPGYYARFGFRSSAERGIVNTSGFEDRHVMARELLPGGLSGVRGRIAFPS